MDQTDAAIGVQLSSLQSKILVTGASGFVGRNMVQALAGAGCAVRAIGREAPPADDRTDWNAALDGVSAVVHLAGRHDGDRAVFDRDVAMTLNLGRQAAARGIERFVYLSSIKANGDRTPAGRPFRETDTPDPTDEYGRGKVRMETGLKALGLPLTVIRPPLVYGPGARGNVRRLMQAVERNWPLPVAAVDNRRSLVSTGNLCSFVLYALHEPLSVGQTYLIADGEDVSLAELLRRMGRVMGRPPRMFAVPPAVLEGSLALIGRRGMADRLLGNLQVDISKARQLGWTPPLSLDAGLLTITQSPGDGRSST